MKRHKSPIAFYLKTPWGSKDGIYTSWIMRIKRDYGVERWLFNRIFFRAWHYQLWIWEEKKAKTPIVAIIEAGLRSEKKWIGIASPLEDNQKAYVESWIGENIPPYANKKPKPKRTGEFVPFKNDRMKIPEHIGEILESITSNIRA